MKYELVAGLETHVELSTKTKLFCSCEVAFGKEPNTLCCPVCLGHPGVLPVLNKQAVRFAVMAGLALNCEIAELSLMDRKNYSYPDLPKAYQITQLYAPLCKNGYLELSSGKRIRINRIQLEEDAGKLIHTDNEVYVDYNRCGVPLIEIVSEPDFSSAEEAREYLEKLRILMRYIGISDCRMQEGSMRFDVNVSVKEEGSDALGIRTEIKNMNSISNMIKGIEYEYNRHCEILSQGGTVEQQTMRFDDVTFTTSPMRSKEDAQDYRFFCEPDIPPVVLCDDDIADIKKSMPLLPFEKKQRYMALGVSHQDADQLSKYRNVSEFFDEVLEKVKNPLLATNFIITKVFATFKSENDKEDFRLLITPVQFAELLKLVEDGSISKNLAKTTLDKMLVSGKSAVEYITAEDTKKLTEDEISALCKQAIDENARVVNDYKSGKEKALMALLGAVMRLSKGKADPEKVTVMLKEMLS